MGSWSQAGRILQGLREQRVWSVPRFADELKAKAATIGRTVPGRVSLVRMIREWEAGDHRPRDHAILFILVYATGEELSARIIQQGSELDRLMAAFEAVGIPVNRRQFLLSSAAIAAGVAVGPVIPDAMEARERFAWTLSHPARADLKTVAYLHDTAADLRRRWGGTTSSVLPHEASRHLERVTLLREHAPSSAIRQQLYAVEAVSATLLGQLIWDASCRRDAVTPARCYEQAVEASTYVNEGWAEALPRVRQCLIAIYHEKDPKRALDLASRAAACAADGSSHVLAGESFAFVAEAYALLGEEQECNRALDCSRLRVERIASDDPLHARVFTSVDGFAGICHLYLGDPKSAELILRESSLKLGAGREKSGSVHLSLLAVALIRQRSGAGDRSASPGDRPCPAKVERSWHAAGVHGGSRASAVDRRAVCPGRAGSASGIGQLGSMAVMTMDGCGAPTCSAGELDELADLRAYRTVVGGRTLRLSNRRPEGTTMRFSVWPSANQQWTDVLALAEHAEQTGWDGVWFADHFMPNTDEASGDTLECWTVLATLAARVPRVRLGSLVCGNTYRHPAVLAKMAATVDVLSGGRLVLGIGAGWQHNEHRKYGIPLFDVRERLARLDEACTVIKALTTGRRTSFQGRYYQLEDAPLEPKPVQQPLPLLVGGGGEKVTLRIAAAHADEWNTWGDPAVLRHKIGVLHRHCEELGRDPAEIRISAQALVSFEEAGAVDEGMRLPLAAGPPDSLMEVMAAYREAGVGEFIVPDFNLGTGAQRREVVDRFLEQVARPFTNV